MFSTLSPGALFRFLSTRFQAFGFWSQLGVQECCLWCLPQQMILSIKTSCSITLDQYFVFLCVCEDPGAVYEVLENSVPNLIPWFLV